MHSTWKDQPCHACHNSVDCLSFLRTLKKMAVQRTQHLFILLSQCCMSRVKVVLQSLLACSGGGIAAAGMQDADASTASRAVKGVCPVVRAAHCAEGGLWLRAVAWRRRLGRRDQRHSCNTALGCRATQKRAIHAHLTHLRYFLTLK